MLLEASVWFVASPVFSLLALIWSVMILPDQNPEKGSRASFPVCPCCPALAPHTFVCEDA